MGIKTFIAVSVAVGAALFLAYITSRAAPLSADPEVASWTQVVDATQFAGRDSASAAFFDGRYVLSGGFLSSDKPALSDLWVSSDGKTWSLATDDTPYDDYAALVTDGSQLLAVGQTVWKAQDSTLTNWVKISDEGPSNRTYAGKAFWTGDRFIYAGGSDIATSPDGVNWSHHTPPFAPRTHYAAALHDGQVFVVAGADEGRPNGIAGSMYPGTTEFNDVWSSSDGENWHMVLSNAPWQPRMWPLLMSAGDYLVLAQGFSNSEARNLSDVWISRDGVEWKAMAETEGESPSPRHFASSYYLGENKLLVVAGNAWPVQSDVWRLELTPN